MGYGAGEATQIAGVEAKLAARVLEKTDQLVVYRGKVPAAIQRTHPGRAFSYDQINTTLKADIQAAELGGLDHVAAQLKQVQTAIDDLIINEVPISPKIASLAKEIDGDVSYVADKLINARTGIVGPKEFKTLADIMGGYVDELAPNARTFTTFYKNVAKTYFPLAGTNDFKWVNFRDKVLTQRYRPQLEDSISFKDPITGRTVSNIYRGTIDDDWLKGKSSVTDAVTGLGVNGNHMNDASLVQALWLEARKEKRRIATVHDGFFANAEDAEWVQKTLYRLMADGLKKDTIKSGLKASRDFALESLGREQRRTVVKRLDKLVVKAKAGKFTRTEVSAAMDITPGLEAYIIKATGASDRAALSKLLGKFQNKALLDELSDTIEDGSYSITKFNSALKEIPSLERELITRFRTSKANLLDQFSKHGNTRRLQRQLDRLDADDLTPSQFYFFAEKYGKVNDVPLLARNYGIRSKRGLEKAIETGEFDIRVFLREELKANRGGIDLNEVLLAVKEIESRNLGGVDPRDLASGIEAYRNNINKEFRNRKKLINQWYEDRV